MKLTINISEKAFDYAKEVVESTTDRYGPGMCEYPESREWSEFQAALREAEIIEQESG